jgi:hypothetical protein
VPNFRRYVAGQSLSLIGTWVETVAQALLVLRLTHSGTILGLTTAARYALILVVVLALLFGTLSAVDNPARLRSSRKWWAGPWSATRSR